MQHETDLCTVFERKRCEPMDLCQATDLFLPQQLLAHNNAALMAMYHLACCAVVACPFLPSHSNPVDPSSSSVIG